MHTQAYPISITGIHTARFYDTLRKGYQAVEDELTHHIAMRGTMPEETHSVIYRQLLERMKQFLVREEIVKNIVVTVGRSVLAQRLANTTTYTGIINYGVLGSSATAVANSDTQLGTEVFRKVVASSSYTTNVAFIDFLYSKADTNGTYQEFGTVIDGTGSANTGQLFTHALTGGWTKTSSESMTVSTQYTIN